MKLINLDAPFELAVLERMTKEITFNRYHGLPDNFTELEMSKMIGIDVTDTKESAYGKYVTWCKTQNTKLAQTL